MASCLGLYIENNLIKYAKVSKSNDAIKVESFGIKFYENIENTIKQIVEETYSFKTPISINLSEEVYNKFEVFSLLSKKDVDGVVKTEFENLCYDKGNNENAFEQRYILADLKNKGEKLKIIHISAPKTVIAQKKNYLKEYKVSNISPIGVTIQNLITNVKKEVSLIVNIEKNTTITKLNNNVVMDVNVLPFGANDILDKIKQKENSYSKAYEICKNSTIYTEEYKDLQYEENEYLDDIMPTLFQVVSEVRKVVDESMENIERVYITGTASVINNIDIYFQDYLRNIKCEILKPGFVSSNSKLNIKDYIEVNSAISTALYGLEKNNDINFTKESTMEKVMSIFKSDISLLNANVNSDSISSFLNKFTRQYNMASFTFLIALIVYVFGGIIIANQMDKKMELVNKSIQDTNDRITTIQNYRNKFNEQTATYERLISNIEDRNNTNSENKRYKNAIPNLLNNIMNVIPKEVKLNAIENTTDTHIVITAQSKKYEQIAYFKTKLKTEGILKNVISDTGTAMVKEDDIDIVVKIEGELP